MAAVLGSGLDRIYPAHNQGLATSILEHHGVLLSELEPDSPPHKRHFPERNRIISGLCDAVLVVGASLRSGSLITARMALEQGRDVFAVPGAVFSPSSQGCHRLIREGAALIDSIDTLVQELGLDAQREERREGGTEMPDSLHQSLLAKMPGNDALSPEHLATIFERSVEETLLILIELELRGFVVTRDGGYIRVPTLR